MVDFSSRFPSGEGAPRLALVLGSGGARGWAHVGVVRALEEAGITADIVAGTSAGALVGAAYLIGELKGLEAYAKELSILQFVSLVDIGFSKGAFVSPERIARPVQDILTGMTMEDMPKSFAVVATDLATGREVWLDHGPVTSAIWASAALPAVFPAVERDGRWLGDGALVNPVPVSLARAMGADVVIAVNVNADLSTLPRLRNAKSLAASVPEERRETAATGFTKLQENVAGMFGEKAGSMVEQVFGRKEIRPNPLEIMAASIDIMQDRITRSRLAGEPAEITIEPSLAPFGVLDFQSGPDLIEAGYEYTIGLMPFIQKQLKRFNAAA